MKSRKVENSIDISNLILITVISLNKICINKKQLNNPKIRIAIVKHHYFK